MLSTLSEQEIIAVRLYDEEARNNHTDSTHIFADELAYLTFERLTPQDEVIDIGSGMGRSLPILEQIGAYHILGIDPAEECVKYCRTQFPQHRFEVDEIRTIGDHYQDRFHGFWMGTVLMHLPRPDLKMAIASLRQCLKMGTTGLFSTPSGEPDQLTATNKYGHLLTLFTPEEIIEAFRTNGFEFIRLEPRGGYMLVGSVIAI